MQGIDQENMGAAYENYTGLTMPEGVTAVPVIHYLYYTADGRSSATPKAAGVYGVRSYVTLTVEGEP